MGQLPVVLIVIRNNLHLDQLMRNLKAHGLAPFGTSSKSEAVRLISMIRPEVVVIDPTSEECVAVLDEKGSGWQSLALVAVVESDESARRAREMGIDEVIMSAHTCYAAASVLELLQQVSPRVAVARRLQPDE